MSWSCAGSPVAFGRRARRSSRASRSSRRSLRSSPSSRSPRTSSWASSPSGQRSSIDARWRARYDDRRRAAGFDMPGDARVGTLAHRTAPAGGDPACARPGGGPDRARRANGRAREHRGRAVAEVVRDLASRVARSCSSRTSCARCSTWRIPSPCSATVTWSGRRGPPTRPRRSLIAAMLGRSGEQAYPPRRHACVRRTRRRSRRRTCGPPASGASRCVSGPARSWASRASWVPGVRSSAGCSRVQRDRPRGGCSWPAARATVRPAPASTPVSPSSPNHARTTACSSAGRSVRTSAWPACHGSAGSASCGVTSRMRGCATPSCGSPDRVRSSSPRSPCRAATNRS